MKKSWLKLCYLTLVIALVVAVAARFYLLGAVPVGIHADEASYGYDAYSLLKTGKDIWGNQYPLIFKSFGEYKLNLPYLIAPAISAFGLNTFSTRLPSAVLGLGTVVMLYLTLSNIRPARALNLFLSIIFAASPWAFGLSRVFYESNSALFFLSVGIFTYVRAKKLGKPDRLYYLGLIGLALAGYFYAPMRFIGLAIFIFGLFWTGINIKKSLLIYLLVILPILPQYFSGVGLNRLRQESARRDFEYSLVINENRALCGHPLCYLYWNKPIMRAENIVRTFLRQLDLEYLFLETADTYIISFDSGAYLAYLAPFFLVGLIHLIKKQSWYYLAILFVSLLVSASAAKVTIYRNAAGLYLVFLVTAFGLYASYDYLIKLPRRLRLLIFGTFLLVAAFMHTRYLLHYFRIYRYSPVFAWSADAEELAKLVGSKRKEYRTIIDKSAGDFGPLYMIFYNADDPDEVRARAEWTSGDPAGWTHIGKLGNVASHDPRTIENHLCEKASAPRDTISVLYLTAPMPDYSRFADRLTYDLRGQNVLHEIYDIDNLFARLMEDNPANLARLCPLEVARWPAMGYSLK